MTLAWYVTRLFVRAWASITLLLAVLFNFIEFFEKLARVKQVSVSHIFHFLGLNFLPSAFDVMPISAWLATLFVLRELTTQRSWDFLQLIGFIPRKLVVLLTALTLGMAIGVGVVREAYVLEIAQRAEQFKYAFFKKQQQELIFSTWFELEDNRFCYIEELDCARFTGKGVMVVTLNQQHAVASVMQAPVVVLDPVTHCMHGKHVITVYLPDQRIVREAECRVESNYFFSVMSMKQRVYHLAYLYKALLFSAYLPKNTVRILQQRLVDSLWYYASFIAYPLLTIYAFNLPLGLFGQWAMALLPYPGLVVAGLLLRSMLVENIGLLVILFFIIFLFGLFSIKRRTLRDSLYSRLFKS